MRACLPSLFFTRPSSIGARGREGGMYEEARKGKGEGAQPAIALSAVFAPNGAAGREAPLEDRARSARRDQ